MVGGVGHPSSVGLPRVESGGRALRLLRLRADERLASALIAGSSREAARLHIKSRAAVEIGEAVEVEVSFGPMADEITLLGAVCGTRPAAEEGRSPTVLISFPRSQTARIRYVRDVLAGQRQASARRDRRIPVDLEVTWRWGQAQYASRVRDLSRGGAFIASRCLPEIGSSLDVEIRDADKRPLHFNAVVSWIRRDGSLPGFGIQFRHQSRDDAARLTEVVRAEEQRARP